MTTRIAAAMITGIATIIHTSTGMSIIIMTTSTVMIADAGISTRRQRRRSLAKPCDRINRILQDLIRFIGSILSRIGRD